MAALTSKPASSADPDDVEDAVGVLERLAVLFGDDQVKRMLFGGSPADDVTAQWTAGLQGFSRAEVRRGLRACRSAGLQFVPRLPEFLRLCRPALDPQWAWEEAQEGLQERRAGRPGVWSHPAVYRACMRMPNEVASGDWSAHRVRWTRALQREFAAGWGERIPAPPERIEHQPAEVAMPPAVKRKLADLINRIRSRQ